MRRTHVSRPTGLAPINAAPDDLNSAHIFFITTPTLYPSVQTTRLFLQKIVQFSNNPIGSLGWSFRLRDKSHIISRVAPRRVKRLSRIT